MTYKSFFVNGLHKSGNSLAHKDAEQFSIIPSDFKDAPTDASSNIAIVTHRSLRIKIASQQMSLY